MGNLKNAKLVLFGPPGIGKSTIVKQLGGLDLEDSWNPKDQSKAIDDFNKSKSLVIGAAGFHPSDKMFNGSAKILLYLRQDKYEARRARRDKTTASKASQSAHRMDDWLKFQWDYIIPADKFAVESLIRTLQAQKEVSRGD